MAGCVLSVDSRAGASDPARFRFSACAATSPETAGYNVEACAFVEVQDKPPAGEIIQQKETARPAASKHGLLFPPKSGSKVSRSIPLLFARATHADVSRVGKVRLAAMSRAGL